MRIAVIGDRETVAGFALGGASLRYTVEGLESADKALAEVMKSDDVAVLLITTTYSKLLEREIAQWKETRPVYPLVVEVAPRRGGERGTRRIDDLIRRAVGITADHDNANDTNEGNEEKG
ncbi:MAG: V-type ATP synthase subunit F [Thermoplasmata archaeon]|nr:V-type ATP synthase subunit F [Thermoplasmata archaeon]